MSDYVESILSILAVLTFLYIFVLHPLKKGMRNGGFPMMGGPNRPIEKKQVTVTFEDVAGVESAKEELLEIVDYLKNPDKYIAIGAKIPRGILYSGPPGTGKTLIAKAVAGEAACAFYSTSASEFVEVFVGVGAGRIRRLFSDARKNSPAIIFIDEIDAVGRRRSANGGHDETDQTLNQLLTEMDGFEGTEGVIVIGATNRGDILDKALLRPGRFDRKVILELPDLKGRRDILSVHAKKIKAGEELDLLALARMTPGASGADLASIINEAALFAAKENMESVYNYHCKQSRDKVIFGKSRTEMDLSEETKQVTAYHEAGHAIVACHLEKALLVEKVTIIPRGHSLGATYFIPKDNHYTVDKTELMHELAVLFGGRNAEKLFLSDINTGASSDIERATDIATRMVCQYGMHEELGLLKYESEGILQHNYRVEYSEITKQKIDEAIRSIIKEASDKSESVLREKADKVHLLSKALMEFETVDQDDVRAIAAGEEWSFEKRREEIQQELKQKSTNSSSVVINKEGEALVEKQADKDTVTPDQNSEA